jgi:hypothetical protein
MHEAMFSLATCLGNMRRVQERKSLTASVDKCCEKIKDMERERRAAEDKAAEELSKVDAIKCSALAELTSLYEAKIEWCVGARTLSMLQLLFILGLLFLAHRRVCAAGIAPLQCVWFSRLPVGLCSMGRHRQSCAAGYNFSAACAGRNSSLSRTSRRRKRAS